MMGDRARLRKIAMVAQGWSSRRWLNFGSFALMRDDSILGSELDEYLQGGEQIYTLAEVQNPPSAEERKKAEEHRRSYCEARRAWARDPNNPDRLKPKSKEELYRQLSHEDERVAVREAIEYLEGHVHIGITKLSAEALTVGMSRCGIPVSQLYWYYTMMGLSPVHFPRTTDKETFYNLGPLLTVLRVRML
jgi:hypothetical protein